MLEFKLYITVMDMNNIKTWRKVGTRYRGTQVFLDNLYLLGAFVEYMV